jgi:hypothetical protein
VRFFANLIGFNLVWFALVIGAARGLWWVGLLALVIFAVATLATSPWPRTDARLVALALGIGLVFETFLVQAGILRFESALPWATVAPLWMLGLWANFALSINHSLGFLGGRPVAAAILGAVAGPLAYWSAASVFDAADILAPLAVAMAALAIGYAVATPVLTELAYRWRTAEGSARPGAPPAA